jgi:hypothetical protein
MQESPDSFNKTFILKQESGDSCAETFVLVEMQQQRLLSLWAMKRTSGIETIPPPNTHLMPTET